MIGKKISLSLALHGAKVVIIDKNIKNLKKLNSKIIYEQLDVTQEDAYRKYSKIMKKYKSPDIFINLVILGQRIGKITLLKKSH